ncbi:hypothetical protein KY284_026646 [Solanum tuberosum]|nr:hypothetical protein KY284_026646 [Solanum tuberosum]
METNLAGFNVHRSWSNAGDKINSVELISLKLLAGSAGGKNGKRGGLLAWRCWQQLRGVFGWFLGSFLVRFGSGFWVCGRKKKKMNGVWSGCCGSGVRRWFEVWFWPKERRTGVCWEIEVREDRGVFGGGGLVGLTGKIINNEKPLFVNKQSEYSYP